MQIISDFILRHVAASVDLATLVALSRLGGLPCPLLHDGHGVFFDLTLSVLVRALGLRTDHFLISLLALLVVASYEEVWVDQRCVRGYPSRLLPGQLEILETLIFCFQI